MFLLCSSWLKVQARTVVIIGGGLAGAQVAIQLRQRNWAGPITILSQEKVAPYWRPPLSKSILAGIEEDDTALIRRRFGSAARLRSD